ncbi:hypothetical protein FBU30_007838 [Linnemannia zychae]|nr:hypothetical protein FBU30_007838 [Linnemannia zychae]
MFKTKTGTRRGSKLFNSVSNKASISNERPATVVVDTSVHDTTNGWSDESDQSLDESSYYVPSIPFNQRLAALDPALYQGTGDDFCTEENFEQTSAYINHQLNIHGFSSNLQFMGADKHGASRIVTALYKILQQHLKDSEYKEEMDLNWRRLSQDYDTTLHNLNIKKTQLARAERESDTLNSRISALEDELKAETEKHRYTREELKSAKANLQYSRTQYAHESRKKEQEITVLKEKLQKSISRGQSFNNSSSTIPGGITILNPVHRPLYAKNHTNEAELLLKEAIEQQQTKEAEIVEENEQLRRTLYTVQVELEGLLKKHSNLKSSTNNAYGLPFEMVKDKIETEIRDTLTLVSDQWNHRPSLEPVISPSEIVVRDQKIESLQKEIEKLQLELEDSTLLVQGAQKMIDNLSSGNFLAGLQDLKLNVEGSDMTVQEIDEAENKIRKQREDLARERKRFTQACLDLGKEREELQKAKADFEESKRTFTLDKVMEFLSFSPTNETRTLDVPSTLTPEPSSPISAIGAGSKKRLATSPMHDHGRSVRPKLSKTTVVEVPDDDDDELNDYGVPDQRQAQKQWQHSKDPFLSDNRPTQEEEEEEEEEELIRTNNIFKNRKDSLPTFGVPGISRTLLGSTLASPTGKGHAGNHTVTTSVIPTADQASLKPTTTLGSSIPGRSGPSSTFTTSTPTPFVISFNDSSLSTSTPSRSRLTNKAATSSSPSSSSSMPSTLASAAKSQPFNFTATLPPNTNFKSLFSKSTATPATTPPISFNPRPSNKTQSATTSVSTPASAPSTMSTITQENFKAPSLNASVRMPPALAKAAAHLASRKTSSATTTAAATIPSTIFGGGGGGDSSHSSSGINTSATKTSLFSLPTSSQRGETGRGADNNSSSHSHGQSGTTSFSSSIFARRYKS